MKLHSPTAICCAATLRPHMRACIFFVGRLGIGQSIAFRKNIFGSYPVCALNMCVSIEVFIAFHEKHSNPSANHIGLLTCRAVQSIIHFVWRNVIFNGTMISNYLKITTPQQFFLCSFNNQIELSIVFYCIGWQILFKSFFFLSLVNEIVYHFNADVFWMFLSKIFKHVRFLSSLWVSSSNVVVFCNYNKFPLIGNSSTECTPVQCYRCFHCT